MPAKAKVGSWLDKSNGSGVDEAYESSDPDEEGSSGAAAGNADKLKEAAKNPIEEGSDDGREVDEGVDETKREVDIDWELVMPKIRPALEDQSKKRRRAIIERYLYVNDTSPPSSNVAPIVQTILQTLPLLPLADQLDDAVAILRALVERDETISESSTKLGDKLVKWVSGETEKITSASRSVTVAAYMPYLFLILGLLSSFKASRSPLDQLISTPTFQDLFVSLAYISDAIEAKDTKGKENAKLGRARRKAYTRLWRVLRDYRSVLPAILHSLLTKAVTAPSRLAVLIGHVAGVLVRLRPKGAGGDADRGKDGSAAIETEKEALVSFYGTNIIGSKTPLQPHVAKAFNPILPLIIDQQTLIDKLIPAAERMLLRSPEIALELTAQLLRGSGVDISSILPVKLIPSTLSASKSSNADTRAKSVSLMSAICERCLDAAVRAKVITEVLALAKTGKTASPEHRTTLFQMSAVIQPSDEVSPIVVETLLPLVGKEGNDLALLELGSAVRIHLAHLLRSGLVISPVVLTALGKEASSPKLPIRRMLSDAVGQAIWTVSEGREHQFSAEGEKFLDAILPSLEANLQSASANVPSNPTGFLEGYVAVALALGPLQQVKSAAKFVAAAKTAKTVSPKPSFVLNERAYTKIPSGKDEMWLLRSLEGLIRDCKNAVPAEAIRVSLGSALLHQILRAGADDVRATAIRSLPTLSTSQSVVTHAMVHDGLHHWLTAQDAAYDPSTITSQEDGQPSTARTQKISQLLDYLFSPKVAQAVDKQAMQEFAVDMLIIAHHPLLTEGALTSWINLVQSAGLDPADLAVEWREKIVRGILSAAEDSSPRSRFPSAAYRAITTLAFVQPALYVPTFMDQIRSDLNPSNLDFIGLEERGIWITPADQTYVDVLAQKKDTSENKNRRDYATEKWEAEIRESLAKKRAAAGTTKLSKADQAAVNAQLAKEAEVRTKISAVQARMKRGLEVVYALTASNAERVEREVGELAQILLSSAFSDGSFLLDQRAFEVFMALSTLVTDRLGEYRRLLIAAILRSHDAPLIADDYLQESVQDLVTRLLHQLLFVASQKPLDATSYALISVLFGRVVKLGGVGMESPQSEEAQEQLTLVVNIISACCGEFSDDAYPRLETISHLQSIISRYPRLAKDGSAALVDLGAAIQDNAQSGEVKAMIAGTLSQDYNVRSASLQALQPVDLTELDYSQELWIALHDADEQNASLAAHLWEDNGLDLPESYLESLMRFLAHESPAVRISTAGALTAAAQQYPSQIEPTISGLQELYKEKAKLLQPEFDRFGMVIPETVNRQDPWESRVAIALALQKLTPLISDAHVEPIINFMVFGEALGDRSATVRRAMLDAATAIIDSHGGKSIASLMKTFEDYLGRSTPSSETDDYIKEAVVILFGRLAGHLDSSDDRIPKVVDRLLDALNTPSELVQSAVADCLPTLVSGMGDDVEYLVDKLFSALTTGPKYAGRRGAAYGLAGVVKGRGLGSLKEYDLMDKLREAAEDKSTYQSRQGALFAFETLSTTLGKTFEPYIISIVPLLLALFGDSNTDVREATQDASKVIMSKISGHCVKLMLPDLLDALEEKQWRTKKGAIELLGAMAFCAPRQLSLSLPTIIPQLTGVINDSHAQVKSAANTSLKRFGEVLENPEVKAMQSTLMKALADPTAKTANALSVLLKTRFEHYLDAPSLALVMPIIDRGLRQRSSETRRKSVQIVGNMASLTESRDLVPYLHELMPLVHEVLVDPVPEARATAAKSLGTLVERLGETNFPELVNQLTTTLKSDTSGVDRQGAAQGLSEVLSGLGMERLENMLPEIVSSTASPRPYVREGFISLLVYLPATFGHRFAPHLGRVIPPILNGLADDSEFVREASMRAGKMIISNYSNKAIDLLLPELEKGMLDSAWRIRQSSISLTGELLYRVTGISGKVEMEEEEQGAAIDNARKALLDALGQERRDRVLATLYIVRQDAIGIVRQASIHIWKALVQNTPRTTREILPILMQILMSLLGSDEAEQQETASRTLGELCRKNGERIFGEIIPILQKAISSPDARSREGACLAFADIMAAANKEVLADYEDQIIGAIRKALVDPESSVRSAAAQTFDTAQHYMGAKAVDQTIPTLLEAMRNPGETSETALQALKEVMSVRANSVFPVLIPTLTVQPITAFNARALGALVRVAGSALNKRLDTVLGALVKSLEKEQAEDVKQELLGAIEALLSSIVDADGIHQLEMLLIGWAKDKNAVRRATACQVFGTLCQVSQADTSEYRIDWIRILVTAFDDPVPEVVEAAWEALEHFVKTIDKDELEDLVVPLRRAIESTGAPGKHVAGFSRPKGVQSIVPILLAGVLSGTQEQREQAALGVGDLVQRTSEAAIKPYIIQLTGPLIRVISGQGLAPQIKSAILATLTVLLEEVPQLVRPFHPQLTRTFVKSASDPAALSVRNRAAAGLGELMKHQPRVDPLITELIGAIRSAEKDIAPSIVQALAAVCSSAGKNIGPAARGSIIELVEEAFAEPRGESYNNAIGKVVSGLGKNDAESIRSVVDTFLTAPMPPTALVSITVLSLLEEAPTAFFSLEVVDEVIDKVKSSIGADSSAIARPAREARDIMKEAEGWRDDSRVQAAFK